MPADASTIALAISEARAQREHEGIAEGNPMSMVEWDEATVDCIVGHLALRLADADPDFDAAAFKAACR